MHQPLKEDIIRGVIHRYFWDLPSFSVHTTNTRFQYWEIETKVKSRNQFRDLFMMEKMLHNSKESVLVILNSVVLVSYDIGPKAVLTNLGFGFGFGPKLK